MENEEVQNRSWTAKLKRFYEECKRVWRITKRPDSEEFKTIVKVSAIGILVLGFIGFLVVLGQVFFKLV